MRIAKWLPVLAAAAALLIWAWPRPAGPPAPAPARPSAEDAQPAEPAGERPAAGRPGAPAEERRALPPAAAPEPAPEPAPCVTGRLVFADGSPWPRASVRATSWYLPGSAAAGVRESIETDEGGRFRLPVRAARTDGGRRGYRLTAADPRGGSGDSRGIVTGSLDLSRELAPDEDLGDVVLDHGLALAEGRVVDAGGAPVADAHLLVRAPYGDAGARRSVRLAGTLASRDDGTFELFAQPDQDLPAQGFELSAQADGFAPCAPVAFAPGARGLELRLGRAGAIAGSVRLLAGQSPDDVRVTFRAGDDRWNAPVGDDGAFRLDGLAPGTYAFRAELRLDAGLDRQPPAVEVDDVLVRAGEVAEDPRLQNVVIAALVDELCLRVVDDQGQPVARATVRVAGEGRGGEVRSGSDGRAVLRGRQVPLDLEVEAFGFRPAALQGVAGDREVALQPGLPARISCGGVPAHGSEPRYDLGLRFWGPLRPGAPRAMLWPTTTPLESVYFDAAGELRIRFPAPGRYVAEPFVFVAGRDNVGRGGNLSLAPELTIDVAEVGGEQSFRVEIPRERLEAFVARLSR